MKHKEESTKHEKMLKDLVKTEMSINDGELLNPEIINELNISKKEKRLVKKKVLISKNKMKKRIEDIKKNNAKLLKGKSINTKRKK